MKKQLFSMALVATTFMACGPSAPQLGKASLDDVIAAMTLEEKAHLVIGTGMAGFTGDSAVIGETKALVPGAAGTTYPIERLGIPAVVLADGPAGLRINPKREGDSATYYCTHFPIGTLLASTWNQELVESVGKAIGNEVLEYGADVLLAPALNTHRNPLCGRNFEYYSEDPVVSGKIAAAYVNGVQSNGVGTSIKHFAVNNQETNRMANDARVSPRALREIYLKGFEIAVKESQPWTVMSSYNYLNGTYTSENKELLSTLLRDEWGFKGMVMTDWFGGKDAVAQMIAGNDMLQPGQDKQYEAIVKGVKESKLDEAVLNRNVKRILEMILRTPRFKGYEFSNKPDLKAHAAITRQSATEGMVLLKNEKEALPFTSQVKNIALFGCTSYDFIAGGTGSGNVNRAYTVSLLDGLTRAGYQVNENLKSQYEQHIISENKRNEPKEKNQMSAFLPKPRPTEMVPSKALLKEMAAGSDVALITIGRTSGEFLDRTVADFNLTKEEFSLIQSITNEFHSAGKKVVVVLNIGGVIETSTWKNLPDAILCAWQAGQEGGNSVVDVLSGKVSPSGKLTMTFPVKFEDAASSKNFPTEGAMGDMDFMSPKKKTNKPLWDYTNYEEDIYVGYRYFDTFGKQVSYPFGYGLSYTSFSYENPRIKEDKDKYVITVTVKNTGKYSGKEVVQLYASAPDRMHANKPEKELKAFMKTKNLKPGESATVVLTVGTSELASFDEQSSSWIVTPGVYQFQIASSSRDIKMVLDANVASTSAKATDILKLKKPIDLLKR
jgi:beta-glucosidase